MKPPRFFLSPVFVLALLYLFSWPGYLQSGDGGLRILTAEALVHEKTLLIDASMAAAGLQAHPATRIPGKVYSRFGIGGPLIMTPFVLAADAATPLLGRELARHIVYSSASPLAALCASLVFLSILQKLGISQPRAAAATLLAFGFTILHPYAVYDGYEMQQVVFLLLAFRLGLGGRWIAAGASIAVLILFKVNNAFIAPLFLILLAWDKNFLRRAASVAICPTIAVGAILWLNHARFGNPLEFGYAEDGTNFSPHYLNTALPSLIFSFEYGIFTFSPALALALFAIVKARKTLTRTAWCILALLISQILFHAAFFDPKGGVCWGPRYLTPFLALLAIGFAFYPVSSLAARVTAIALCSLAMAVNTLAVSQRAQEYDLLRLTTLAGKSNVDPQLVGCAKILWHKLRGGDSDYPLSLFAEGASGRANLKSQQTYRGMNFWYWQAANRFNIPALKFLFPAFLAYYLILVVVVCRLFFAAPQTDQESLRLEEAASSIPRSSSKVDEPHRAEPSTS